MKYHCQCLVLLPYVGPWEFGARGAGDGYRSSFDIAPGGSKGNQGYVGVGWARYGDDREGVSGGTNAMKILRADV